VGDPADLVNGKSGRKDGCYRDEVYADIHAYSLQPIIFIQ